MKLTLEPGEIATAIRDDVLTDAGGQAGGDGKASYEHHGEDEPVDLGEHYAILVTHPDRAGADLTYGYHRYELPDAAIIIDS